MAKRTLSVKDTVNQTIFYMFTKPGLSSMISPIRLFVAGLPKCLSNYLQHVSSYRSMLMPLHF